MRKIILFQGAILSKGRTFVSLQDTSQTIEYSSIRDISKLSSDLVKKNFDCYFLFWEKDIKAFKNDIFFQALDQSKIIAIPNIDFPRGKLKSNLNQKNKLFHYYAMHYGITYLISNNFAADEDILIRTRTDIKFDIKQLEHLFDLNIKDLIRGKIMNQYWMESNSRWFIDFIFGGKLEVMFQLYNRLYKNCLNDNDFAYSVHQDIIKTIASLYLPRFLIYKERSPKVLSRNMIQNLLDRNLLRINNKPKSFLVKINIFLARVFIKISVSLSRLLFSIYVLYESFLLYGVYELFIIPMTFKFQSSIVWRGKKCTDNYEEFVLENKNSELVFSLPKENLK
tara:strand:- start:1055 stop:2068 length:1014 start_codon:yes stop_codon:yes gene_type:complete